MHKERERCRLIVTFNHQIGVRFPANDLLGELNSFRGRKYAPFLLDVTRCDLYQENLNSTAIQQIASALQVYLVQRQEVDPDVVVWRSAKMRLFDITFYDLQQLIIVFDFAASQQLTLFNHS